MAKFIRIKMASDGTTWEIPAEVVANNSTDYYMSKPEPEFTREEEFESSMDDYELTDWAGNNMNWSDVSAHAVRVPGTSPTPDYESDWGNADMEVIER